MSTELEYQHDQLRCRGYVAYEDTGTPKPAVMIAPSWAGRDGFVCDVAERLASLGYVGFALDMYGDAQTGASNEENETLMSPLFSDRALLQGRISAAYQAILEEPYVDENRVAAIGFCFGGLCVLDLARTGAPLSGVISVHGLLVPPANLTVEVMAAPVLVLHGYMDPMVPPEQVLAFAREMQDAHAEWELCAYGRTMHAFTNPEANDPEFGTVYDPVANARSWERTTSFLSEVFTR